MPRQDDGSWTPPSYSVDPNGKVIGYVNNRTPNNWGRWGELDEYGTTNYITAEIIRNAASLIKTGQPFSLAIPLDRWGPVHPARAGGVVHQILLDWFRCCYWWRTDLGYSGWIPRFR